MKDTRHLEIGGRHRALSRYYMIISRVKNSFTQKNSCYQGVKILVGKEEFIEWFMKRDFIGCSVDRIDKDGHYELSNMQVITLRENIAKDKLIAKDGMCRCVRCKSVKPLDQFTSSKTNLSTGRTTLCKACDAKRYAGRSASRKEYFRMYYKRKKLEMNSGINSGVK